ncbi:probable cysteine--tRNA ligase, mitochondrial [Erinaceus europaeus]|uniref:cysteine--tRNA ligase n=1 Tax=Erinaceus europaeus TaxID=9365 RepID=A0ABM3WT61_ERIEU|nr:probable cysteine--tRNA ligase, mitochondrial [Erinaceus europaeus]
MQWARGVLRKGPRGAGPGGGGGGGGGGGRAASGARGRDWVLPAGHDTGVAVYNSLTRRKDPLIVSRADAASWYSCGPTVYDHAHLGHACSFVRFDVVRRVLSRVFGCHAVTVMGVTDVDDKIIRRARQVDTSPASLARYYEEDFKQDMAALNVLPPTLYMRVTDNVPHIVAFVQRLVAGGHAYPTPRGDVYFDVRSRGQRYGKLGSAGPGAAEEPGDSDKRHPSDFALWKAARPQEPSWASPWGPGRPGWHIECSTIASLVFGARLDIHSGGADLAFPHHENEIAQCEAFHQSPQWANYFLHAGHLHVKGQQQKMSKSLKNSVTIKDFLKTFSPDTFRLFCLRSSYRAAVDYSESAMQDTEKQLLAVGSFLGDARAYVRGQLACGPLNEGALWDRLSQAEVAVRAALADDLDTPRALDAVLGLVRLGNRQLQAGTEAANGPRSPAALAPVLAFVERFFETVGISLAERQCSPGDGDATRLHGVLEELVRFRHRVRELALDKGRPPERQLLLDACDVLRRDLAAHGVGIKDRAGASTWELWPDRRAGG